MKKNKQGFFITFEGPEGSGKSTLVKELNNSLTKLIKNKTINYSAVFTTREPGGNKNLLCENIRQLLLSEKYDIPALTEAFLFAASRSAHIIQTIKPALEQNQIVLCDRFVDSSIVYQQIVKQLGPLVTKLNQIALQKINPDLIFYLRVQPQIGLERISKNKRITNRFDNEGLEFHQKVLSAYDKHFHHKKNTIIIDANQDQQSILSFCIKKILEFIK